MTAWCRWVAWPAAASSLAPRLPCTTGRPCTLLPQGTRLSSAPAGPRLPDPGGGSQVCDGSGVSRLPALHQQRASLRRGALHCLMSAGRAAGCSTFPVQAVRQARHPACSHVSHCLPLSPCSCRHLETTTGSRCGGAACGLPACCNMVPGGHSCCAEIVLR